MNNIYRYNRSAGLKSVSLTLTDEQFTITYKPSITNVFHKQDPDPRLIAGDEVTVSLSLSELKNLPSFDDGAMLSFNVLTAKDESPIEWRNLFVGTVIGRRQMLDYLFEISWNTPIRILVPAKGITSIKQCKIIIQMDGADLPLECNVPVNDMSTPNFNSLQFVPKISGATSASADSSLVSYAIQLLDSEGVPVLASGTIYLEATAGNLTRYRVDLDANGRGSFDLLPLGLSAGDVTKLKAGFRYFPGVSDLLVSLT